MNERLFEILSDALELMQRERGKANQSEKARDYAIMITMLEQLQGFFLLANNRHISSRGAVWGG